VDKNIKNFPDDLNSKLRIEAVNKKVTVKDLIIDILNKYFEDKK